MGHLEVESDAQNLLKVLQGQELDPMPKGIVYHDKQAFICLNFISVSFSYSPRICNNLVHEHAPGGPVYLDEIFVW
jgi:hypothetical protein